MGDRSRPAVINIVDPSIFNKSDATLFDHWSNACPNESSGEQSTTSSSCSSLGPSLLQSPRVRAYMLTTTDLG